MGLETKYDYKYYTVIDINDWIHGNEEWFDNGFTWEKAINFINHKLKTSEDKSANNFRVEYAKYCDDISVWRRQQDRNKNRPIFIRFQENQTIRTRGKGDLFVLFEVDDCYEEDDRVYSDDEDYIMSIELPNVLDVIPQINYGSLDDLAGYGGRL